jgi:hypothetical protein
MDKNSLVVIIARVLIIYDLVSVSYPPVFLIPRSRRYTRTDGLGETRLAVRDEERHEKAFQP